MSLPWRSCRAATGVFVKDVMISSLSTAGPPFRLPYVRTGCEGDEENLCELIIDAYGAHPTRETQHKSQQTRLPGLVKHWFNAVHRGWT